MVHVLCVELASGRLENVQLVKTHSAWVSAFVRVIISLKFVYCLMFGDVGCSDCRYGTYVSQECSSTADTQCSECTKCVELEVETRECVRGLDATCDSCKLCSFDDASMAEACMITEKYYFWKLENCCRTSYDQDVPCDELEVFETKYKLGILATS